MFSKATAALISIAVALSPLPCLAGPVKPALAASTPGKAEAVSPVMAVFEARLNDFLASPVPAMASLAEINSPSSPATENERTSAAALYRLIARPTVLNAERERLIRRIGPTACRALELQARQIHAAAKTDETLRGLLQKNTEETEERLRRFFEGTAAPSRAETADFPDGGQAFIPGRIHDVLDIKTINDLELLDPDHGLLSMLQQHAVTSFGRDRLAYLVHSPLLDPAEIRGRQQAVAELLSNHELRKTVDAAFQKLDRQAGRSAILAQHDDELGGSLWNDFFSRRPTGGTFAAINLWHAAVAFFEVNTIVSLFRDPTAVGFLVGFVCIPTLYFMCMIKSLECITKARNKLLWYKAVFQFARELAGELLKSPSAELRKIGTAFSVDRRAATGQDVSKLAASLRHMQGDLALLPDFIWMHGAKTLWRPANKLLSSWSGMARVLGALGEIDLYRALARYAESQPRGASLPEVKDGGVPLLEIKNGHHPFLALQEGSVPNSLRLEKSGGNANFLMLTGSNMGGKSTYIKTAAMLALLARIGSPVPAEAMVLTPLRITTSIDIRDNLASGKSLYDAETDRILEVVRRAERSIGGLFVLDEILQGTNPEESNAAQQAIIRYLARTHNLFLLSTHNQQVTKLAQAAPELTNAHVEETVKDGAMTFSHKILDGPSRTRNGLTTLEVKGFPEEIVREARRIIGEP